MRSLSLLLFNIGLALTAATPALIRRQGLEINPDPKSTFLVDFFATAQCNQGGIAFVEFTDPGGALPYNPNFHQNNCISYGNGFTIDTQQTRVAAELNRLFGDFADCTVTRYSHLYETSLPLLVKT